MSQTGQITNLNLSGARGALQADVRVESDLALCVQPVSATPLVVYRLAFRSPRFFADVD
jgi:hypothetical protein